MKKVVNTKKALALKAAKVLALLVVGYALHITAVEAVTYKLYRSFGDCLINDGMPPMICSMMVEQNITTLDKAILYMPNLGKKALDARIQKYIDEHQAKSAKK